MMNPADTRFGPENISVITKLLDPRHILILEDWISFLGRRPREIIIYAGTDEKISRPIDTLREITGITCKVVPPAKGEDLRERETEILKRLVGVASGRAVFFINLDTLPFRKESEVSWLADIDQIMTATNCRYFTSSTLKFRQDQRISDEYYRTRRFSNNCGLIEKDYWLDCMGRYQHPPAASSRYHSEWAIEQAISTDDQWGLRRVSSMKWRVLHVQQWDERVFQTRVLFRRGTGIRKFLRGYQDDFRYEWQTYFNYPKPSLARRLRIHAGRLRRSLIGR